MILIMRDMWSLIPAAQTNDKFMLLPSGTTRSTIAAAISESLIQLIPLRVGGVEVGSRLSNN